MNIVKLRHDETRSAYFENAKQKLVNHEASLDSVKQAR